MFRSEISDMDARNAITILEHAIHELEQLEPKWKNCRECPLSGKCCDGAFIYLIFPEEAEEISRYLQANPEKLAYAKKRAANKEGCYFYDKTASQCLIHDVRPLLCRWTPYTAMTGFYRDDQCNFEPFNVTDLATPIKPGFIEVKSIFAGAGKSQKMLHLQGMKKLWPLLERAKDCMNSDEVLKLAVSKKL